VDLADYGPMIDYDAHDWRKHLLDLKGSMVRQIFYRVLSCVAWSGAVVFVHERLGYSLAISSQGHTLIGVALGLLLVFRTNASYDRFWEGRRLWGSIVNETRNLGRSVSVLLASDPHLAARAIAWTIAFPYATMQHLRGEDDLGPISIALPTNEVGAVQASSHPPLAVARLITLQLVEAKKRGLISDYLLLSLDQNVQLLIDYMGGCERIHKTPLPFAYVVHLRRALIAYCFTLPFALLDQFEWGTIAAVLLIAYTLFGIEEIGVQIEDPFGSDDNDLPLKDICSTIEANLRMFLCELEGETSTPVAELSAVDAPSRPETVIPGLS